MYYVEKWINGKLYFKTTPKGEWQEFTIGQYKQKIIDLEKQVENLNIQLVSNNEVVVCECPQLHAVNRICTYCKKIVPKSKYRKAN